MRISDAPCRECQTRKSGCHQHCESYIGWKKKQKELKDKAKPEREQNDYEIARAKKFNRWREEHR